MEEIYCQRCERKINTIPLIGEKFVKFKDGVYCQKCAESKVKEKRNENKW